MGTRQNIKKIGRTKKSWTVIIRNSKLKIIVLKIKINKNWIT